QCSPISSLFPYTTLFRSHKLSKLNMNSTPYSLPFSSNTLNLNNNSKRSARSAFISYTTYEDFENEINQNAEYISSIQPEEIDKQDRKSTRLNSSHVKISY